MSVKYTQNLTLSVWTGIKWATDIQVANFYKYKKDTKNMPCWLVRGNSISKISHERKCETNNFYFMEEIMTRYEQMKNRIDNLERGLKVRKMKKKTLSFWNNVKNSLIENLNEMTIEEAEKLV